MSFPGLPRMTGWRPIATILILAGAVAATARFAFGLGATTNLSEAFPWGLWIGLAFLALCPFSTYSCV